MFNRKFTNYLISVLKRTLSRYDLYVYRQEMVYPDTYERILQNSLLAKESGVLHLGAHTGQEVERYEAADLRAIWVEANPEIFRVLKKNVQKVPNQEAFCYLLSDVDGEEIDFFISGGDAGSSSMFELGSEVGFDNLEMIASRKLRTSRLDSVFSLNELATVGHWVVDVQGAELKVLAGAGDLLSMCNSMYIEVSTREVYKGGASYRELKKFLASHGLHPLWEPKEKSHENLIFLRVSSV